MKFAKKTDIFIIAMIAVVGLFFWLVYTFVFAESGKYAEIYYQSELVKTVDLTKDEEGSFSIDEVPEIVFYVYGDGSIAFIESDCPDKICTQSGRLHKAGQYAACLPNQVYMKIVSDGKNNPDDPDIVVG